MPENAREDEQSNKGPAKSWRRHEIVKAWSLKSPQSVLRRTGIGERLMSLA